MNDKYGSNSIVKNIFWKGLERSASLLASFMTTFVLVRLLEPSDFGLIAIVQAFVLFMQIFVSSGLENALVQKRDADDLDFCSAFWLNIVFCSALYFVLFYSSPLIAKYYDMPEMTAMLRVLGLNLFFAAIRAIQGAYIARNMIFRNYFYSSLSSKILSGLIGIALALMGYGVWALVMQSLSLLAIECIVLMFRVKWRPKLIFSVQRAKALWAFAWRLYIMTFVEQASNQLRKLLVGKKYQPEYLAFYNKGDWLPLSLISNITTSLNVVMLPVLSDAQDDNDKSLLLCRRWVSLSAYCSFPLLMGLIVAAKEIIIVLMTDKWLPAVPYLQLACIFYAAWIIEMPIRESLKANNYTGTILRMQILKSIFSIVTLILVINKSVLAIAITGAISGFFNIAISSYYGNKHLGYRFKLLVQDISSPVFLSTIMGGCIYATSFLSAKPLIQLMIEIATGLIVYIGLSRISNNMEYANLRDLIRGAIHERR